jgi:hypothetical protein
MAQTAEGLHCGAVEHILVVDDSRLQRRIVLSMLKHGGVTASPRQALAQMLCSSTQKPAPT